MQTSTNHLRCAGLEDLPAVAGRTAWPWADTSVHVREATSAERFPRISIVTPSYNQGEFLEETIRSVLLQGYSNLEYIVIDGGSSDNSTDVIRKYEPWLSYWTSEQDRGQSDAINKGMSRATGEIVGWLNSDDYLLPGALRTIASALERDPDAVAWAGNCHLVDRNGRAFARKQARVGTKQQFTDFWHGAEIAQPGCFFRRTVLEQLGGVREDLHYAMDVDLWIRLAEAGRFATVDADLACSRIYAGIKSLEAPAAQAAEMIAVSIEHGEPKIAQRQLERFVDAAVVRMPATRIMQLKGREHYLRLRCAAGALLIRLGLKKI